MHSRDHQVFNGAVGIGKISKLVSRQTKVWWFLSLTGQSGLTVLAPSHPACVCVCGCWCVRVCVCVLACTFETRPACTKLQENSAHWPEQPLFWETLDWFWQGEQQYVGGNVIRVNYTSTGCTFSTAGVYKNYTPYSSWMSFTENKLIGTSQQPIVAHFYFKN